MKVKTGLLLLLVFAGLNSLGASPGYCQEILALASGGDHTVALRVDRTVWTWGRNANGQLGDGSWAAKDVPTRLAMLRDIVSVAAGGSYSFSTGTSLAVRADGTVWAWGWNDKGQLGNGTTTDQPTPVQVKDPSDPTGFLSGVIAVAAGEWVGLGLGVQCEWPIGR
jgi:alpha-tubulin suppressor-like RCC1 family protein